MLMSLNIYRQKFECHFLASSVSTFKTEGLEMIADLNVPIFLSHVEKRLAQAGDMVNSYLDNATKAPLVAVIEENLFDPHTSAVLTVGFDALMDEERLDDLSTLYMLMVRVTKTPQLKEAFFAYSRKKVLQLMSAEESAVVTDLLSFRSALTRIHTEAFEKVDLFKYAMKDAFEDAMNGMQSKPAEWLAKFVDGKLKQNKTSEADTEKVLSSVMELFRYIQTKDVFEAFYRKDLAKRLLQRKSSSLDLEKFFISELKNECGAGYTSKLEGMFKDMSLSDEITSQYETYVKDKFGPMTDESNSQTKMDLWVLTMGYWPTYPSQEPVLPNCLQVHKERFETYYSNKYQGRRVEWKHNLSQCHVEFNLPNLRKTLEVSELQALVLLCFNDGSPKDINDLKERTGIESDELTGILQSLSLGRVDKAKGTTTRVLVKSSKGKEILDSDEFEVNVSFTHKLAKIKIPNISSKKLEEEKESKKALESVNRDRLHQIDAACIRVMKSRKTMTHQDLMSEIMAQIKFKATSTDIKKRIESLIERDYMERGDERSTYNYLA